MVPDKLQTWLRSGTPADSVSELVALSPPAVCGPSHASSGETTSAGPGGTREGKRHIRLLAWGRGRKGDARHAAAAFARSAGAQGV